MNENRRMETIQSIDANIRALRREASLQHSPGSDLTRIKIDRLEREREWIETHLQTSRTASSR